MLAYIRKVLEQEWTWGLGGLAVFVILGCLLGWSGVVGALTVIFTGLVAFYTRQLAELQGEVNEVIENQVAIQNMLARAEVEPLVGLHLALGAPAKLFLLNLGKYGKLR